MHRNKIFIEHNKYGKLVSFDITVLENEGLPLDADMTHILDAAEKLVNFIIKRGHASPEPEEEDKKKLEAWRKSFLLKLKLINACIDGSLPYEVNPEFDKKIHKIYGEEWPDSFLVYRKHFNPIGDDGNFIRRKKYLDLDVMVAERCVLISKTALLEYLNKHKETYAKNTLLYQWLGIEIPPKSDLSIYRPSLTAKDRMLSNSKLSVKDIASLIFFNGDDRAFENAVMLNVVARECDPTVLPSPTQDEIEKRQRWTNAVKFKNQFIASICTEHSLKYEPETEILKGAVSESYRVEVPSIDGPRIEMGVRSNPIRFHIRFVGCIADNDIIIDHNGEVHFGKKYNQKFDQNRTHEYIRKNGLDWCQANWIETASAEECLIDRIDLLNYITSFRGEWLRDIIKGTLLASWLEIKQPDYRAAAKPAEMEDMLSLSSEDEQSIKKLNDSISPTAATIGKMGGDKSNKQNREAKLLALEFAGNELKKDSNITITDLTINVSAQLVDKGHSYQQKTIKKWIREITAPLKRKGGRPSRLKPD